MFSDHSIFSHDPIKPLKWGDFWAALPSVGAIALWLILIALGATASLSVKAAEWRCGEDIVGVAGATVSEPAQVWRDVRLRVDAIDAFSTPEAPNRLFRLEDIAFVPEYEAAAKAKLSSLSAQKVTTNALSGQPDFLGRTPVRIEGADGRAWRRMLIEDGLAMLLPERGQDVDALIHLEDGAINNRVGMWSDRDPDTSYYVRANHQNPGTIPSAKDAIGRFAVIDGTIRSIEHQEWRSYLNFGSNWREDFTIALDTTMRDVFSQDGDVQAAMQDWIGRKVRVRGVIENRGGPYIALHDPSWLCMTR